MRERVTGAADQSLSVGRSGVDVSVHGECPKRLPRPAFDAGGSSAMGKRGKYSGVNTVLAGCTNQAEWEERATKRNKEESS